MQPVRLDGARLPIRREKSGNDYEKWVYTQGKDELAWDTWPSSDCLCSLGMRPITR